jgi:Fur family transcriptional regulator, ferric uptake regulator
MVDRMNKNNLDKYKCILREHGLRITSKRLGIINLLKGFDYPVDAKLICEGLCDSGICINLSTVYRALESLEEAGVVRRINFSDDAKVFFELDRGGHRHFLHCLGCGELICLDVCPLSNYQLELAKETKYRVVSHNLDIYGYCPKCQVGK